MRSVITILSMLWAVALVRGQSVPSQIADITVGDNSGAHSRNSVQLRYNSEGRGASQNQVTYIQFNLSVFPANLTPAQIQKATLVLWVENGGNPGTVSVCQVSSAWSADTITGMNAPSCTNTTMYSFSVSAAQLRQGSFVEVDITPMVQSWYNGTPNYGILLAPEAPGAGAGENGVNIQFGSLQGNSSYPPVLDLVLQSGGLQGPAGPQGPSGSTGATGPQGPPGTTGGLGNVVLSGAPTAGQVPVATSPTTATWQTVGGGVLLSNTVTVHQPAIFTLNTVPVTLIPAPPAGTIIFPQSIVFQAKENATYGCSMGVCSLLIKLGSTTLIDWNVINEIGGFATYLANLSTVAYSQFVGDAATFSGQALTAQMTDAITGTGGDFTFTVYYTSLVLP